MDEELAGRFIALAVAGIDREYPNHPAHVLESGSEVLSPRAIHPVFYGHFDWHSSVHGHWTLLRLLKLFPRHPRASEVGDLLEERFDATALQEEANYLRERKSFERMYGWAWALRLVLEARTWDDPRGQLWAERLQPLAEVITRNAMEYLPVLEWPIRCGFHPETAFPLAQMLDYARGVQDGTFEQLIRERSSAFYQNDRDYPVNYEPSGHDFFSAGLNEADLMRRVLGAEFGSWLEDFLPGLEDAAMGKLLDPVSPADREDDHLVHLVGLNLSRAWTMRGIARALTKGDSRRSVLLEAAARHEQAGVPQVTSGSYEGEHWLGSFAVYLLTGVGPSHELSSPSGG